jgi:hypothetical protein
MSVNIETVGLDIDGTKIILTKDPAKELYTKLKELFEDKKITLSYIPYPIPSYPVYPNPIIFPSYPSQPWISQPWITTSGTIPITTTAWSTATTLTL